MHRKMKRMLNRWKTEIDVPDKHNSNRVEQNAYKIFLVSPNITSNNITNVEKYDTQLTKKKDQNYYLSHTF